jgi:hypothetical protein
MWWLWWLACGPRPENYQELKVACADASAGVVCVADESAVCAEGKISLFDTCDLATEVCVVGAGCAACPLDVDATAVVAPVVGDGASADAIRLARVPVGLVTEAGALTGEIEVTVEGAVSLWRDDGSAVTSPFRAAATEFPPLYATVSSLAGGTVRAQFFNAAGPCAAAEVAVAGAPVSGLAGNLLGQAPGFSWVDTFHAGAPVAAGVPASVAASLPAGAQWAIVPHRDAAGWLADPSLAPVVPPVAVPAAEGGVAAAVVWDVASLPAGELDMAYDVVLDRGADGRLDPGDWLDGGDHPGFWVIADLTSPGPYAVTVGEDSADRWRTQRIYYPSNLDALGELPLVIISHGNGHDYTWYDYLGEHLASWGFIVASHRNNTEPGIETASESLLDNTDWIVGSSDTILGGALSGHLDARRIGWVGHSRGGEGVVRAYDRLFDAEYVPDAFTVDDIRVVSSIAPTVFLGDDQSNPHDVPYHILFGAADGDVSGAASCDICQSFKLAGRATGEVQTTYLQGASHNDFNCCGFDDGTGPDQIGRNKAQLVAKSTLLALFSRYLQDRASMREVFTRMYDDVRPPQIPADVVVSSTWRPARGEESLVLDNFEENDSTAMSSAGAAVRAGVANLREQDLDDADLRFTWTELDPMNGMTQTESAGLVLDHGVVFDWTVGATPTLDFDLPVGQNDLSEGGFLQFRAAEGTRHPETVALDGPLSFTVALVDGAGVESGIDFAAYGRLTRPYQRLREGEGAGWQNEFGTVRIRLTDFLVDAPALDLSDIVTVRLQFGDGYGSARGRVGLDDLAVVE